jgi:hypothetical protein
MRPPTLARAMLGACVLSTSVFGQGMVAPRVTVGPPAGEEPMVAPKADSPDDPVVQAYASAQKRRIEQERELYKIRAQFIRGIRNTEMRQIGITKIREFTDPAIFPSLLRIFKRDGDDVRNAILDHLADRKSNEGDATLAWAAIFDEDPSYRAAAADRLIRRSRQAGEVPFYVRATVAKALKEGTDEELASAARLAQVLELVEAIPMLINAQIGGGTTARVGGGGGDTSLAYILVGKQQAFVSDLTPVVADNAVAFDPTLSVVTDGVVLRVIDAVVLTYRIEVHDALVRLSSKAWGQPTDRLGWDNAAWRDWYLGEFRPYWARVQAERPAPAAPRPGPG